jgi:HNH endonuclease
MGKRESTESRFFRKVHKTETCWLWLAAQDNHGYGQMEMPINGVWRPEKAHRISFRLFKGEIPIGKELDHLCRNRLCVNPDHLEAVTRLINVRRGEKANRTHCPRGHEYTLENTAIQINKKGSRLRKCKECGRIRRRKVA